jgi:hypothetical protein
MTLSEKSLFLNRGSFANRGLVENLSTQMERACCCAAGICRLHLPTQEKLEDGKLLSQKRKEKC